MSQSTEQHLEGRFEMTIDAKGRLFFPAKQREKLGGTQLHITRGLDDCLFAFTEAQWTGFKEKMAVLPFAKARQAERFFIGNSSHPEIDAQGRLTLHPALRQIAGLEKEITLVGLRERIEIWDTARWNAMNDALTGEGIDAMLQEMDF